MRKLCLISLGSMLFLPALAMADNAKDSYLKTTGYVEGSYNYLTNSNLFTSGVNNRVFDLQQNGLTLQQAAFTIAYQPPQGFGALLNVIAGRDANGTAAYGYKPNTESDSQTAVFDVDQVYLQYAISKLTLIGGKVVDIAGAESDNPTLDTNFSRSILFGFAEPGTLTGVRGTYAAKDNLSYIVGIDNGWDNIRDWSRRKTLELGINYSPLSTLALTASVYTGQERATPQTDFGPEGTRNLINLSATITVSEKLNFVLNGDYGWQTTAALPDDNLGRAVWTGIAGYANYKFNEKWSTSLRGEIFSDHDGFRTGVAQTWKEMTLTLAYSPIDNLMVRGEVRHDYSNKSCIVTTNNITTSNNQQSYALEAYYKFG